MNHQPTCTNNLYTCPVCSWRAVATGAGLITTEEGDGRALHLAAIQRQQDEIRAEATRIMDRLRTVHGSYMPLPRSDGRHVAPCEELKTGFCTCAHQDGYRLSLDQLQRLYRCVTSEFAL